MSQDFTLLGVNGKLIVTPYSKAGRHGEVCFKEQRFTATRRFREDGAMKTIVVFIRFDDQCNNGRNEFAITGELWDPRYPRDAASVGCIHEDIVRRFPEFAHLIKWHLSDLKGPLGYPGNALYHAGNRDHNGKVKGEPWAWDNVAYMGNSPFPVKIANKAFLDWVQARINFLVSTPKTNPFWKAFEVEAIPHEGNDKPGAHQYSDNYTLVGYLARWATCPFHDLVKAQAWAQSLNWHVDELRKQRGGFIRFDKIPTLFSEGKERELDKARHCAVWPEATDEQLCLPKDELTALLMARLPQLQADFQRDMLACGFKLKVDA